MVVLAVVLLVKKVVVRWCLLQSFQVGLLSLEIGSCRLSCSVMYHLLVATHPSVGWKRAIFLINLCSIGRVVCPSIVQTIFICMLCSYYVEKSNIYHKFHVPIIYQLSDISYQKMVTTRTLPMFSWLPSPVVQDIHHH